MKICKNCGKEVSGNFCSNCGAKVDYTEAAPQPTSVKNQSPPQKKKKGCLIAGLLLLALFLGGICFGVYLMAQNPERYQAKSALSTELDLTAEQEAAITAILEGCGIDSVDSIEHDELLDNLYGNNEIGYRMTADGAENIILYLFPDKSVYRIRYADYDLYLDGQILHTLDDFFFSTSEMTSLQLYCEDAISSVLLSPSTAEFPNILEWNFSKNIDEDIVRVSSYVDAQNAFGAVLRQDFVFEFIVTGDIEDGDYVAVYAQLVEDVIFDLRDTLDAIDQQIEAAALPEENDQPEPTPTAPAQEPAPENTVTTNTDFENAVSAVLSTAHTEHDTDSYWINDDSAEILDETDFAYLIAFSFDEASWVTWNPEDPSTWGAGYMAAYIVEKDTHNILWSGPLQDYWDGMINDLLYGDGGQGSYDNSGLTPDPDPIEAAIAEQEAISNATSQLNPIVGSDYLYINLPSDRTEAKVSVICDGEVIYENTYNTSEGTAIVKLSGSSAIDVDIYIDDEFVSSKTIDFSNEQESNNMDIDGVQSRFSEAVE